MPRAIATVASATVLAQVNESYLRREGRLLWLAGFARAPARPLTPSQAGGEGLAYFS